MNNEGVTSLAVVDNQYNVVGNISNADVKVRTLSIVFEPLTNWVLAPYEVKLRTLTREYLLTFHLRHPFYPWHERWQGFFSSVSYQSLFYTRTHSRKARRYRSAQVKNLSLAMKRLRADVPQNVGRGNTNRLINSRLICSNNTGPRALPT